MLNVKMEELHSVLDSSWVFHKHPTTTFPTRTSTPTKLGIKVHHVLLEIVNVLLNIKKRKMPELILLFK